MSKIFSAMRGTTAPLQAPQTGGGISPFWQPPDVTFGGKKPSKNVYIREKVNLVTLTPYYK
jgi:hypothetical protein